MNLFRYLTGYVTVELVSADPAGALSAFAGRGIRYWNPRQTAPLTLHLCIPPPARPSPPSAPPPGKRRAA